MPPRRVFAIDWSGAKKIGRKIVVAEVDNTGVVELPDDWKSREAVAGYPLNEAAVDDNSVCPISIATLGILCYLETSSCRSL